MGENNDFRIVEFTENREGVYFQLHWRGQFITEVNWGMTGEFNARNLAMSCLGSILAQAARLEKKVDASNPFTGFEIPNYSKCRGVKRRQEILIDQSEVVVISDFGHHPTAIEGTLQSIRSRWPDRKIIACFEPRSNTAVTNVFQDRFADSLGISDEVLLGSVHRADKIPKTKRIDTQAMIQRIHGLGKKGKSFSDNKKLAEFLELNLPGEESVLVVFFSNGSFDGVIDRIFKFISNS
jgi:UDP-N-acetylmuramate: L-alanyl-gamma-D-glutamyl-meso-diaminopimelate ligase